MTSTDTKIWLVTGAGRTPETVAQTAGAHENVLVTDVPVTV